METFEEVSLQKTTLAKTTWMHIPSGEGGGPLVRNSLWCIRQGICFKRKSLHIQACLAGSPADVGVSVVGDVYKSLRATATGNHSFTGRPLGTFSGVETVNLSWHANRSVELAQSPLKVRYFHGSPRPCPSMIERLRSPPPIDESLRDTVRWVTPSSGA